MKEPEIYRNNITKYVYSAEAACAFYLLRREVVQLDEQQEVDELSIMGAVGEVNRAEIQTVGLTELHRQRPLLSRLV